MKRGLGQNEASLLAYAQMRQLPVIRTGELAVPLGLSDTQDRKLLSRLAQAGPCLEPDGAEAAAVARIIKSLGSPEELEARLNLFDQAQTPTPKAAGRVGKPVKFVPNARTARPGCVPAGVAEAGQANPAAIVPEPAAEHIAAEAGDGDEDEGEEEFLDVWDEDEIAELDRLNQERDLPQKRIESWPPVPEASAD